MFFQANDQLYYTVEKPDISSSSFFPFSPPTFHDIIIPAPPPPPEPAAPAIAGRKRPMRKDRHSKINTAQGPRDRRMRLSLDVARKFFDLQDLLGFDKASKTVQWLLSMSKAAIKELVGKCAAVVSSSEGEEEEDISTVIVANEKPKVKMLRSRALLGQPKVARESREKARARARERTLEKKMMRCGRHEYSSSHDLKSSLEFVAEMEDQCSASPIYGKEGLFQEAWDHMSGFQNSYVDEKVFVGEGLLLQNASYGRAMFDHV